MSDHLPIGDREHQAPTPDHQADRSTPASHPAAGVPAARPAGAGPDPDVGRAAPRGDAGSRRRFTHGLQRQVGNRQTGQALGLGRGAALEPGVRSAAEQAYGTDFSGVQIHTGGPAEKLANAHDARAVSIGPSIAFGAGEYRPGELDSDVMLAHELAHVAQQAPGDPTQAARADPGAEALEADADRSAVAGLGALRGDTLAAGAAEPSLRSMLQVRRCGKTKAPASAALAVAGATSFGANTYVTRTGTTVVVTITGVVPPASGSAAGAVTWTGGVAGATQFERQLPTPVAGVFPITATGGGKTLTVTIHAVVSTPLPATNTPALLRHILSPTAAVPPATAAGLTVVTIGQQGVTGPEFDVTAHLDGAQWKFRVSEIRHTYKVGTHPAGRTDISGPGDADITPDTIGPIISDLTPPAAGAGRGPARTRFLSLTITRAHEEAHVNRFYSTIWPTRMRTLESEIETATQAFDPGAAATAAAAVAAKRAGWQARADTLHGQADAAEIVGAEVATHDVSNPMYTTLIASIRDTVVPPAPSGLTVTPGSGSAALTWTPTNVVNTTGFVVQRRIGSGPFTDVATVGTAARSHTDSPAPAGSVTYRVLAAGAAGRSAASPVRTVTVTP